MQVSFSWLNFARVDGTLGGLTRSDWNQGQNNKPRPKSPDGQGYT